MNPIALVTFSTRVGPWLGRAISSSPGLLATLVARLRVGGAFAGKSVGDIVKWIRANPANATLLATTLASLGMSVASLFDGTDDEEVAKFAADLNVVAQKAAKLIDGYGAENENAAFGGSTEERKVQDEVAITVLSWARSFFGGVQQSVEAHRLLQAFIEMPLAEVRHGFDIYKLK